MMASHPNYGVVAKVLAAIALRIVLDQAKGDDNVDDRLREGVDGGSDRPLPRGAEDPVRPVREDP